MVNESVQASGQVIVIRSCNLTPRYKAQMSYIHPSFLKHSRRNQLHFSHLPIPVFPDKVTISARSGIPSHRLGAVSFKVSSI